MTYKPFCLTEDRIKVVVFEAEVEALEGLHNSGWNPGQHNLRNNAFRPKNKLEDVLFKKVQEVTERSYKMGQGIYGKNSTVSAGGSRKRSKRMTRRA